MTNTFKIYASTEIAGAVLTNELTEKQKQAFATNPKDSMMSVLNLDLSNFNVNVVENTGSDIHIALPYYESLDTVRSEVLADESLSDIAGGEIGVSLAFLFGSIGFAFGIGSVTAGIFSTGAVLGGVAITSAVAATAVVAVGGVAGTAALFADAESDGK